MPVPLAGPGELRLNQRPSLRARTSISAPEDGRMKLIVLALAAGTAVAECPNVSSSVATKAGQRKAAARERPARGSPRRLNAGAGTPAPTETHKRAARGPPSARTARAARPDVPTHKKQPAARAAPAATDA